MIRPAARAAICIIGVSVVATSSRVLYSQIMTTWRIDSADAGVANTSGAFSNGSSWGVSAASQGVVVFPTNRIQGQVIDAQLGVSLPDGLAESPLPTPIMHLYGFESSVGTVVASDYNMGEYIGDWQLPINLLGGVVVTSEVTSFVSGLSESSSPYIGFDLRIDQGVRWNESFASPSFLFVTVEPVPEPQSISLLISGIILLGLVSHFRLRRTPISASRRT